MKKERREYEFLCLSAEERYRLLIKRSPDLVRQVTQNEIARYLGITPVALSRIRGGWHAAIDFTHLAPHFSACLVFLLQSDSGLPRGGDSGIRQKE